MALDIFQLSGRTALGHRRRWRPGPCHLPGVCRRGRSSGCCRRLIDSAAETVSSLQQGPGDAFAIQLDVTNKSQVEDAVTRVVESWGTIDVLVNCAGRAIRGTALEYKEEDWNTIIDVNLKGTFFCCQAAGRYMASHRSGKIINIASIGGFIAYPGSIAYLASKGGVVQLTRGFAVELAPYNVQVNAIAPSLFDTAMVAGTRSDSESQAYFMTRTPAGRKGRPEEIIGAAIFLAADCSNMVTGHTLAVDGGFLSA